MKTVNFLKQLKPRFSILPLIVVLGFMVFASCNDDDVPEPMMEDKNIVDVAVEAGQFGSLIQAAQKAGLADFLSTEPNITVFSPTDDAFTALLADLGVSSLDELDAATLASVLTYHVVGGTVYSNTLASGVVPSLNTNSPDKEALSLLVNVGSEVMINNAKVM